MPKLKIQYKREGCIGAFACLAVDAERWAMAEDGKADLTGGIENNGIWELTVDVSEDKVDEIVNAAEACPVAIIKVTNLDSGEVLAASNEIV